MFPPSSSHRFAVHSDIHVFITQRIKTAVKGCRIGKILDGLVV